MQQIRADIYKSLFVFPIKEHTKQAADSLGETLPGPVLEYKGYYYEGFERVLNTLGQEELSHMQIYLRGEDAVQIQLSSTISCGSVQEQRIVSKKVYYGRDGSPVIGVLYLP